MKTIGLLGGMSWESTVTYYRLINEGIKQRLGGLHSAKIVLVSVDFAEVEQLQHVGDWQAAGALLTDAAAGLQKAGADFMLICTNTMHKVAAQIQSQVSLPLLHIADATADKLLAEGVSTVGLLGTRFTMEQDFYKQRLIERGLTVVVPDDAGRSEVNRVIYDELCLGQIRESSRQQYQKVIRDLQHAGAEAVILGCTEIGLLVRAQDSPLPLYDTTEIHAKIAVQYALECDENG
ncbi:aspartate/glutamate racemase family protein [Pseudohongiella spirulinae]|uniref:Racemase n=1 Tax=Pseudohongiella spirulinae TaxID=1249552 RepID=A0A0S2KHV4_9GAMM|nr:aspartate/glutamate racemase family protein [Pseudohongiella spirulinae]ALO47522.1 racemase [Pseudohongiella spirulinae]